MGLATANLAEAAGEFVEASAAALKVKWKDFIGQVGLIFGMEVLQKPKPPEPPEPKKEDVGPPPPRPEKPDWLNTDGH